MENKFLNPGGSKCLGGFCGFVLLFRQASEANTLPHKCCVCPLTVRTTLTLCLRSEAKSKIVSTSLRWTAAWRVPQRSPTLVWVLSYLSRESFFLYQSKPFFLNSSITWKYMGPSSVCAFVCYIIIGGERSLWISSLNSASLKKWDNVLSPINICIWRWGFFPTGRLDSFYYSPIIRLLELLKKLDCLSNGDCSQP